MLIANLGDLHGKKLTPTETYERCLEGETIDEESVKEYNEARQLALEFGAITASEIVLPCDHADHSEEATRQHYAGVLATARKLRADAMRNE